MRRVVITGLGCCSSLGHDPASILSAFQEERTAFVSSEVLPPYSVCPVASWGEDSAAEALQSWRYRRYLSCGGAYAVLAGLRAVQDAGFALAQGGAARRSAEWHQDALAGTPQAPLAYANSGCSASVSQQPLAHEATPCAGRGVPAKAPLLPSETSVIMAGAPMLDFMRESTLPPADGSDLDALWLLRWLPNTPLAALAHWLDVHGESLTVGTACASALQALGEGARRIALGLADTVLVAAGDSRLSAGGLLGYAKARALSPDPAPQTAIRPFECSRQGFVAGEGGAAFVLESEAHAAARQAPVLAEILGFGASLDGGSLTAPDATGQYAEQAVRHALACAALSPSAVDWVAAHGTGTLLNDQIESALLERVFADQGCHPAVTALKSWVGHLSSACGAMELALMLIATRNHVLPPIRNLVSPCSARLDWVRTMRFVSGGVGLLESFGFGGQNAALVVRTRS